MRRLLVLDSMRGWFIMGVVVVHAFSHLLFWNAQIIDVQSLGYWLIPFLPLALLGTWAPIFGLISGTATAYVLYHLLAQQPREKRDGRVLRKHVMGVWANSFVLMGVSLFHVSVLHYGIQWNGQVRHTMLTGSLELGRWAGFDVQKLFYTDAIFFIAMCGFIIGGLLWLLWRGDGLEKRRRNYLALIGLGVAWFAVAPMLQSIFQPMFFQALSNGNHALAAVLKVLVGPPHSTFPNVGFALFGAVMGIALAERAPLARIQRFGFGFGVFWVVVAGVALLITGLHLGPEQIGTSLPVPIHMLNLGLMLILMTVLIARVERQPLETRRTYAHNSIFVRRFGLMALTCYVCESVLCVINMSWFMPWWEGASTPVRFIQLFSFGGMQLLLWYGILRAWEKVNFKFSLEWFVVHVGGWLRGRRSNRLEVAESLYNPLGGESESEAVERRPRQTVPAGARAAFAASRAE